MSEEAGRCYCAAGDSRGDGHYARDTQGGGRYTQALHETTDVTQALRNPNRKKQGDAAQGARMPGVTQGGGVPSGTQGDGRYTSVTQAWRNESLTRYTRQRYARRRGASDTQDDVTQGGATQMWHILEGGGIPSVVQGDVTHALHKNHTKASEHKRQRLDKATLHKRHTSIPQDGGTGSRYVLSLIHI